MPPDWPAPPPGMPQLLLWRIQAAFTNLPDPRGWRDVMWAGLAYALLAVGLGWGTGLLRWRWTEAAPAEFLRFTLVAFFLPACLEELLFRALVLPHPLEQVSGWAWGWRCGLALAAFVAVHPLNAYFVKRAAWPLFARPEFLAQVVLLGLAASWIYQRTGSVWPVVLLHWMVVVLWRLCLGGELLPVFR